MTTTSKMYVTSEFVNDAQFACNTLYVFGAAFKAPFELKAGDNPRECILCYHCGWLNHSQYNETNPVSLRLSGCDYGTLAEWPGGYGVPTCIDMARKLAIVKIPYLSNMATQWIGYLTYVCNDKNLIFSKQYCDRTAFYFVKDDYINPSLRGNCVCETAGKNDVTYLCFDLSAMNLAATLVPVYTDMDKNNPTCGSSWGNYVCSHYHNLATYSINENGYTCFGEPLYTNNMVDSGTVSEVNRNISNTSTGLTSNLINGDDQRILLTADGRYVSSTVSTCCASDYLTRCSCACISMANTCVYISRTEVCLDETTGNEVEYNPYEGCNNSAAQLHLNTSQRVDFNDIIYFVDDESVTK